MTEEQKHMARLLNCNPDAVDALVLEFINRMITIRRDGGQAAFESALVGSPHNPARIADYLTQENSVLHERVRKLEIKLQLEREGCAQLAEQYGIAREAHEMAGNTRGQTVREAANSIASLIRGRGET